MFEPATRPFLERFAGHPYGLVVDLGCGPGHSTGLLAEVLAPGRILGLDQSPSFVALAAGSGSPPAEFAVHDVTVVPFPCPAADLVFCRFLLSHLPDPGAALAAWATQLAPGGLLLVEEVERIHTGQPALRSYLETAAALLAARGHTLEVGARLQRLPDPRGWSAATTGLLRWPRRPVRRPGCSARTWPSGATTPSVRASRPAASSTGWPATWRRSPRAGSGARSPGSCASSRSSGAEPGRT